MISCVDYLRDIFFPHHLAVFYPHPALLHQTISNFSAILAGAFLVLITLAVFWRLKRQPYLAVGWLWFLATLIPVIGLVQLGGQARADRYTYLPSIGITFAIVWFISDIAASRRVYQLAAGALAAVALVPLMVATWSTTSHWRDTDTLFDSLQKVQPNNFMALSYNCEKLVRENKLDEAIALGRFVTEEAPNSSETHAAYAMALWTKGDLDAALDQFIKALSLDPGVAEYWDGLGAVRDLQAGRPENAAREADLRNRAVGDFKTAVKYDPDLVAPRDHLAYQLARVGKLDEAIDVWEQAIEMTPNYAMAQGHLADALRVKGDLAGAVEHYRAAIEYGSNNPDWETRLAWLIATSPQATQSDVQPMIAVAKEACLQTSNQQASALDAYAACLARAGLIDNAIGVAQQALTRARADGDPAVVRGIGKRLALYQKGQAYVKTDDTTDLHGPPSTQTGPTTR